MHYVASVPSANGRIWLEDEVQVAELRKWDPIGGRTDKGLLHFWAITGGYRCLDVEDIVTVTSGPTLKHAKIL